MAHPYLNRRQGRERVTYPHPSLEPILKRTLGVPLFQEQLLRMAMTAAGFTGGEAEELRRAMGFKRSVERMKEIEEKLRRGLANNSIRGAAAEQIVRSITAFALYGFPESHSASFALLAYASAYLKAHHTAEFTVALLNCQPMGFYSPAVLVKDAQRHGVRVRPIDVQVSDVRCVVESDKEFRLGLMYVSGLRAEAAAAIEQEGQRRKFTSVDDLVRRVNLRKPELDVLAEIGALNSLGKQMHRREALWQIEKAWHPRGPLLQDLEDESEPCPLASMTPMERLDADYRGSGMTTGPHPMHYLRDSLNTLGVLSAAQLEQHANGKRVRVAGAVIVRQRPGTAKGFLFLSMEDETGISNIIVRPPTFQEYRAVLLSESFIMVEGVLQKQDGTVAVRAERVESVRNAPLVMESHDFH
jgi:error-prone DNA polymerase